MEQQKQQFFESVQKILLLSLLVIVSNLFLNIKLFGDTELLFGSIFVLMSLQLLQFRYALIILLVSLASMIETGQLWQEITAHVFEFLVIAFLIKRNILIILAASLYWIFLGAPLVWFLLQFSEFALEEISVLLTIHTGLNALLCAAIAASLLAITPLSFQNKHIVSKQNKLASNIFALCASTLMVPLLLISFIFSADSAKEYEKLLGEKLNSKAMFLSQITQNFLQEHQQIVSQHAKLIELGTPEEQVRQSMILAQEENPAFFNITIANSEGGFIFFAPEIYNAQIAALPAPLQTISDRQYFIEAKRTEEIYISDALVSRGVIEAPMVSIAAPYKINNEFGGIVFGSINLQSIGQFKRQVQSVLSDTEVLVTDQQGKIVFTSLEEYFEPLSNYLPISSYSLASNKLLSVQINDRAYLYERETNDYGWKIYALTDAGKLLTHLQHVYFVVGISLICVLSIFLIFAYNLSSKITEPLVKLINSDGENDEIDKSLISNSAEFEDVEQKLKRSKDLVRTFENRLKQQVNEKTNQLEQLNLQLAAQAREDGLTHLFNRSGFDELAINAIKTNYRHEQSFSLALLDIDHFKDINDNYGHPFGDKCLKSFAALLLRNCKRDTDIIGRYGGEEFIILMSGKGVETHHQIIQNIHQQTMGLQQKDPQTDENVSFTVSIGICSILGNVNMSLHEIIKLADEELYKCKRSGRNRISIVTYGYTNDAK